MPVRWLVVFAVTVPAIQQLQHNGGQKITEINSSTSLRPRRLTRRNIGANRTLGAD